MNVELYNFTVLTSILGMAIVFSFLWLLSLLMSFLVSIFKTKTEEKENGKADLPEEDNGWILAAAVAFLSEEDRDSSVSAAPWKPDRIRDSSPWMILGQKK